jgi:hypothetical protein
VSLQRRDCAGLELGGGINFTAILSLFSKGLQVQ